MVVGDSLWFKSLGYRSIPPAVGNRANRTQVALWASFLAKIHSANQTSLFLLQPISLGKGHVDSLKDGVPILWAFARRGKR